MTRVAGTIGAFDLLHVGHVRFLQACRAQCDYLKVGLGADATCERSKQRRPVIDEEQRMEMLRALRCVDEVRLFTPGLDNTEATADWIAAWQVDLIFVSEEWRAGPRWSRLEPALAQRGIAVAYLPYTEGVSTSAIKARIRAGA
ncbi:adenylyltransferase/cytidyltransferase family protein [Massilia sp. TS11]|uniref:adenylyltransferase/cytidyltransferase family protein n=1 Tax=Massilia sp. TS11 TaxID=2908003 RepID=UPI001EDBFBD9|nr:adenylyltransferase/cytidyltransferase family protein [Massilia sp. TS11]MCG2585630.1 adenylyltransferase/cytidyltransferase family protein [Massilia sp. TS11]